MRIRGWWGWVALVGGLLIAGCQAAREKEQALLVQQGYGRGQVLFVGLDSTWRWRFKVGDKYHHRFWGQLVRWAASDKLLEGGNRLLPPGRTLICLGGAALRGG